MGRSRHVAAIFNPLLMVIYPVPKAALMPIIMLWLGVGDVSKTLVIFLGVRCRSSITAIRAPRGRRKDAVVGRRNGNGRAGRLLRIVLPSALPEIMIGCRTGIVLALITMVTSEMIARQTGVGNILFNALDMAQYDTVYAMIVVIGVLGFVSIRASRACAASWLVGADA